MGHAGAIVSGSQGTAAAKAAGAREQGRARRPHADPGRRDRGVQARAATTAARRTRSMTDRQADLLRARRAVARHRRRRGPEARPPRRAFADDPAGMTAYGTAVGYLPLREWIAEQHGVAPEQRARHQRLDAGRRVPVRRAGRARRHGHRRAPDLRPHAAVAARARRRRAHGRARARRDRRRRRSSACSTAAPRPKLAHIIPNFQNPAGYTLSRAKRERLLELAREHGFVDLRGRPLRRAALQRRAAADDALDGRASDVVYASSFSKTVCPGIRVGYLVGPAELIARIAKLATNTYISPNMVAQAIVNEFCALGRDRALDRDGQGRRCASASQTLC